MKVFIFLFCSIATAFATEGWVDCGGSASDHGLDISDCPRVPCVFSHGDQFTITGTFTSNVESRTLVPYALITAGGIELDITELLGIDENACNDLVTGDCPIQAGEDLVYRTSGTIIDIPGVSGDLIVTMILAGDNGEDDPLTCAEVHFYIE
ncbi:unnamed protein product [Darwinula stevensoni]|uniref:MD-2-related lipid-recognition domain-containing protein n=1 Tax=Darwinula stevensoni TaxID=69355 RepID=A0A7R9FT42_9CRUS|nr:unnamed protein product [Darwinula stevensoni]CAG0903902.1 unnamed protein product [Darwinula stevensoni]